MDGTRADRRINGQLDRPAPISVIVRDYPDIVIGLITGKYAVSAPGTTSPDGAQNIRVSLFGHIEQQFIVREDDFKTCQKVAQIFAQNKNAPGPASAFPSEPITSLRARIAAQLRVEFAGRGT